MNDAQRARFDEIVAEELTRLPGRFAPLLDELHIIVEDLPDAEMLADLGMTPAEADELCGLHTGVSLTDRSVEEDSVLPTQIHLFRTGILFTAEGWDGPRGEEGVRAEIRITLLHELGHQLGLDEDDLADLGYA
ncbi:MAG: hypothetical protein DHS20C14_05060 [Phycisphaeraceae bacterium]|nr:MAG: hypothetical protein DHS20C14_05060 [Phycisphaeraceae bacterium]